MANSTRVLKEKYFSFAEVVQGRNSSVKVTDNGLLYAVDLVMVMTGNDRDMAGNVLRRLPDSFFQSSKFIKQRSPSGGYPTKLVSFHDAIELVMVLPGKRANKVKAEFARIIQRYLAGDRALISEIESNAASTLPITNLARESIGVNEPKTGEKRRQREDDNINNAPMDALNTREQLHFINNAFEYQKEAIELRHERQLKQLEFGGRDEEEILHEENRTIEEENEKIIEDTKQLELELEAMESELLETETEYKESVEAVRILSGLYLQEGFSKPEYQNTTLI